MARRATYTITYTKSQNDSLDDDFVLLVIEAHSHEDAMLIVENMERYFGGVTITCDEKEKPKLPRKCKGRRLQRAKSQENVGNR